MTGAVSSFQSGAQIALKLLRSGAASEQTQALGGVTNPTTANSAALDKAMHGSGTKIILSTQTAINYFGPRSDVAKAASLGDHVEVTTSGLDVPEDKAAFRQQVLDYFKDYYANNKPLDPDQAAFAEALKAGKVIVKTVDETPELNWQPQVDYTIYKDGYSQGGGGGTPWIGNYAQYEAQSATRGQASGSIGSQVYYAYFEK